jgi:hypothetical protein
MSPFQLALRVITRKPTDLIIPRVKTHHKSNKYVEEMAKEHEQWKS